MASVCSQTMACISWKMTEATYMLQTKYIFAVDGIYMYILFIRLGCVLSTYICSLCNQHIFRSIRDMGVLGDIYLRLKRNILVDNIKRKRIKRERSWMTKAETNIREVTASLDVIPRGAD